MNDRIVAWLGQTPRERLVSVAPLLIVALAVVWFGRDDPLPSLLLWAGFALTLAGLHRLFPTDGSVAPKWAVFLVLLGFVVAAAAESLDGDGGWSGFALLGMMAVFLARQRKAGATRGA